MKIESIYGEKLNNSPEHRQKLIEDRDKFLIGETRFNFLNDHKGLRPGCTHVLMSTTGAGKSSLLRSIAKDHLPEKKIFWFSTEEVVDEILTELVNCGFTDEQINSIIFSHENEFGDVWDWDTKKVQELPRYFKHAWMEHKYDIVFFDNITTSVFADNNYNEVPRLLASIRTFLKDSAVAMFLVAHTKKGQGNKLIEVDDVRGPANAILKSEYVYTLQSMQTTCSTGSSSIKTTVTTKKSRGHDCSNRIYLLDYRIKNREYVMDTRIDFNKFKKLFHERDRL